MNHEIELGRLNVVDENGLPSELVLTNLRLYQHRKSRVFETSKTIIPHEAIATVRMGWRRVRWLLGLGMILLLFGTFSVVAGIEPSLRFSQVEAELLLLLGYGLLGGGVGMLLLFWFYKRSEIQIMTPTITVGGRPRKHADYLKFSSLLLSVMERPTKGRRIDKKTEEAKKELSEAEWRL